MSLQRFENDFCDRFQPITANEKKIQIKYFVIIIDDMFLVFPHPPFAGYIQLDSPYSAS